MEEMKKHKGNNTFVTKSELLRVDVLARNLYHGAKTRLWILLFWNLINSVGLIAVIYLLLN